MHAHNHRLAVGRPILDVKITKIAPVCVQRWGFYQAWAHYLRDAQLTLWIVLSIHCMPDVDVDVDVRST